MGSSETRSSSRNAQHSSFAGDDERSVDSHKDCAKDRNGNGNARDSVGDDVDRGQNDDSLHSRDDGMVAMDAGTVVKDSSVHVYRDVSIVSQGHEGAELLSSTMDTSLTGQFEESVELRLRQICYANPTLPPKDQLALMRKYVKKHNLHNTSWFSTKSVR